MSSPHLGSLGERLATAIERAKAGDPLQRVDVLVPTRTAAVALRHALAEVRPLANVELRPLGDLVAELARRSLPSRTASREMEREALRLAARSHGSLSRVLTHPAATDAALACHHELLASAPPALDRLRARGGTAAQMVALSDDAHDQVVGTGLADARSQLDAAAFAVAQTGDGDGDGTLHPLVALIGGGRGAAMPLEDAGHTVRERVLLREIGKRIPHEVVRVAGEIGAMGAAAGVGGHRSVTAASEEHLGNGAASGSAAGPATWRVVRCSDPDEEVRAAVRQVVQAARDGLPLWRQAVLHPGMARYERLLRQQFAEAGVPVHGIGGPRLRSSPPAALVLGLLDAARGGWRREQVVRWLASAPVRQMPGQLALVPAGRWDRLAAEAGVVEGPEHWRDRLAALAGERHLGTSGDPTGERAGRAPRQGPDHAGGAERDVDALMRFMEELLISVPDGPTTWTEWAAWAKAALERYLAIDPPPRPAAGASGAADEVLAEAAAALGRVLDNLAEADNLGGAPVGMAEMRHALAAGVDAFRLPQQAGRAAGVEIGALSDAVGLDAQAVYAIGLADAWFPGAWSGGTFLTDADRLAAADPALPGRAETLRRQEEDWRATLATGTTHVLSYPRSDPRTGRELSPSRWLEELVRSGDRGAHGPGVVDQPSFVAGVRQGPPATADELRLRRLVGCADAGLSPAADEACRTDPILRTGMEAIASRAGSRLTRFDGLVPSAGGRPWEQRPVSATRLETYADCPRRFLFTHELRALPPDRPEDRLTMEPTERGTLVHRILEIYTAERLAGSAPSLERLLAIAQDHFDHAATHGKTGAALLWESEQDELRALLRRFFAADIFSPVATEVRFGEQAGSAPTGAGSEPGAGPTDPLPAVAVAVGDGGTVQFRGTVDRVDHTSDGGLLVTDYKTGFERDLARRLRTDPVARGTRLQLPLYSAAVRAAASRAAPGGAADGPADAGSEREPAGAGAPAVRARFWVLSAGRSASQATVGGAVGDPTMDRFAEAVRHITTGVRAGMFAAAPDPFEGSFDRCRRCPFNAVCPTDRDREWAAKAADPALEPLHALRAELDGDGLGFGTAPADALP